MTLEFTIQLVVAVEKYNTSSVDSTKNCLRMLSRNDSKIFSTHVERFPSSFFSKRQWHRILSWVWFFPSVWYLFSWCSILANTLLFLHTDFVTLSWRYQMKQQPRWQLWVKLWWKILIIMWGLLLWRRGFLGLKWPRSTQVPLEFYYINFVSWLYIYLNKVNLSLNSCYFYVARWTSNSEEHPQLLLVVSTVATSCLSTSYMTFNIYIYIFMVFCKRTCIMSRGLVLYVSCIS